MLQTQIRYIQNVLTLSIFISIFLNNLPLITAALVGIILAWHLETLICELRTDNKDIVLVLSFLFIAFIPVFISNSDMNTKIITLFIFSIVLSVLMLITKDIELHKIGNLVMITIFAYILINFFVSDEFRDNYEYVTFLFLILFFLKTMATFLKVQFSNFQYFLNFFGSFFVITVISIFSGFDIQFVFITAVIVSIFTVFFNLLFLRNRQEYEYFSELTTQIFIFDYLIAFMLSFYFVDAVKIVNGLF